MRGAFGGLSSGQQAGRTAVNQVQQKLHLCKFFSKKRKKCQKKRTFSCIYRKLVVILRVVWILRGFDSPQNGQIKRTFKLTQIN